MKLPEWTTLSEITKLSTPWFTLFGERLVLQDPSSNDKNKNNNNNKIMDYWRVERADSVVVMMIHPKFNAILLPQPIYRPGIKRATLDFCGGRVDPSKSTGGGGEATTTTTAADMDVSSTTTTITAAAKQIVERELHLDSSSSSSSSSIQSIQALNPDTPWPVNSSFSNQGLYGYVCELKEDALFKKEHVVTYPHTKEGCHHQLLADFSCLQCRAVLLEYLYQEQNPFFES
jgi:hypothetical protein